jgi:3-phenylpropionate/cinnamic acid dioxygenase small subunit
MKMIEPDAARIAYLSLIREVEDFLYEESDILDERRYEDWLGLFSDDCQYWMPMRKNLPFRERERDITDVHDIAWFHDDKLTLTKRVDQIMTGVHWAEEPVSRVSHLVSNVRLMEGADDGLLRVKSHFILHRNRLETETDWIAGRRHDTLRPVGTSYQIVERKIIIDQSVLLAKNLTFFF